MEDKCFVTLFVVVLILLNSEFVIIMCNLSEFIVVNAYIALVQNRTTTSSPVSSQRVAPGRKVWYYYKLRIE